MARALEALLGERLAGGIVVVPSGENATELRRVRLMTAPHPTPDQNSVRAAKEIAALAEGLGKRDLLICPISGGGSSLLSLPADPLRVEDKARLADALMKAGAGIVELNAVRKHLSAIKGGWLAKRSGAGRIVGLLISDVVGDRVDSIASGPISPDQTTYSDAISILKKYGVWDSAPGAAVQVLQDGLGGKRVETPKADDECFRRVSIHIIGSNRVVCQSAQRYLQSEGIKTRILTSSVTGEARDLGSFIGSIVRETCESREPFGRPCAFVIGGETTVTVRGDGLGGRNQECAMSCAKEIQGLKGVAVVSAGTDGIDGPTDAAGAVVDGETIGRSEALGLRFEELLASNDSYKFFSPLNDLIVTGRTGTNVNDVAVTVLL
jgi:glycerate-2-kinase